MCVVTGVHACLYIQCVFWLPNVHLVRRYCQGEVEVSSTQLNHWTALSWPASKAGKAVHSTMSSSGNEKEISERTVLLRVRGEWGLKPCDTFYWCNTVFTFQTVWFSVTVQYDLKKMFPRLLSHRVGSPGCVSFPCFFFFLRGAKDAQSPLSVSAFHPWMWSIMDGTPTAWQAGIAWKKLGKPSAILPAPECCIGDRALARPPISTGILPPLGGCDCLKACSKTHTHTRT